MIMNEQVALAAAAGNNEFLIGKVHIHEK